MAVGRVLRRYKPTQTTLARNVLGRFTTLAERLAAEDAEEAEKGGQTNVYRVCACAHPWGDAGYRQASDYLFHRPRGQKSRHCEHSAECGATSRTRLVGGRGPAGK